MITAIQIYEREMALRIKIGSELTAHYHSDPFAYTDFLVKSMPTRWLLFMSYNTLVLKKKLRPIEELSLELKNKLWYMTKEIGFGKLNTTDLIQLATCLYVTDYFLSQNTYA